MNATPSRIGQINGTGDEKALFLKVFSGEVLVAFNETTQFLPRTMSRTITSGKSAQFPATGKSSAAYHVPGTELTGSPLDHAERVISIDDVLLTDHFLSVIDEAMNHYEVRQIYSTQMGEALAVTLDKHIAQIAILAARSTATVTGLPGGTALDSAGMDDTGTELLAGAFGASQALDEKDVPQGGFPNGMPNGRNLFVKPAQYYLLVNTAGAIDRDFGGQGSIADGTIFRIAGLDVIKTNNLPTANITNGPTAYRGDFTKTVAVACHQSCAGTVRLIDVRSEMGYDIRRQGTLLVAKVAVGHGILRPESSVELALT